MLWIETKGSWREMGRQLGEEFRDTIKACMEHYAPWLLAEPVKYAPAIQSLSGVLEQHCPVVLEETHGLAEAVGTPRELMLGYRLFNEVRRYGPVVGCSAVFLAEAAEGPLLGRNCDLRPTTDPDFQLCRTCRPDEGAAVISTTYLGMVGGVGVNEHGLGLGGASAHTDARYGDAGLPAQVLCWLLMYTCRRVTEARELLAAHPFLGKSANLIVADDSGASVLLELAPGAPAFQTPRRLDRSWQACTNFFASGQVPIKQETPYLENAYARYGRIVHLLDEGLTQHSLGGLKQLLTDIAQPGVCTRDNPTLRTAYSHVMDLKARTMHVTPGHPAEVAWKEVAL